MRRRKIKYFDEGHDEVYTERLVFRILRQAFLVSLLVMLVTWGMNIE